jgi:HAAS
LSTSTIHPLVAGYLQRLRRDARRLPRATREELLSDIEAHLAEATNPGMPDAEVLTVLERLGEPEQIVEAQEPPPALVSDRRGLREWATILLLLFGGFAFGVGWLVGLVLLWSSRAWTTRDKWIGTLVVPGGLVPASIMGVVVVTTTVQVCTTLAGGPRHCTGGSSGGVKLLVILIFALLVIAPIMCAIYLARRAR